MSAESSSWEKLAWMVPVGAIISAFLWRLTRPACESFFFFIGQGNEDRHKSFVSAPIKADLEKISDHDARLDEVERVLAAHAVTQDELADALRDQGIALSKEISQVLRPLQRTMEKIEGTLERIAKNTNDNSVAIGELRGMWDGSERRQGERRHQ
jgi:hypothetical protein